MSDCRWCDEGRAFLPGSIDQHVPLAAGDGEHSGCMCHNSPIYRAGAGAGELGGVAYGLERYLSNNLEARIIGRGGHDGDGNAYSVVAIPDWQVRQYIETLRSAERLLQRLATEAGGKL